MQLYRLIYYSKSALRVSGDVSSIIRSTWLYLQYLVVFIQVAASRQQLGWTLPDTVNTVKCFWWWAKHRPKHVELTWNNKLIYIVHLVGYFHSWFPLILLLGDHLSSCRKLYVRYLSTMSRNVYESSVKVHENWNKVTDCAKYRLIKYNSMYTMSICMNFGIFVNFSQ